MAIYSYYLIGSISEVIGSRGITSEFISLVLILIAGNATKYALAMVNATRNKISSAISVAMNSSIQTALITYLLVVIGWIISQPMSLYFENYKLS